MKARNVKTFIQTDLWRISSRDVHSRGKRAGLTVLKTAVLLVRGFVSKDLNIRANALTYSLMFAIVPILAMVLAIAKGFGFADVMETHLNQSIMGEMNMVPTVMGFVERYLQTAHGGLFIGIGLLVLIWAVYSFFRNVEVAFNRIWNVQRSRSLSRQLINYIFILFIIPVLIIVTSGLSLFLNTAAESVQSLHVLQRYQSTIAKVATYLIVWLAFTGMYKAIPNTHVRFGCALVPGILTGTLFQLLQALSVYIIVFLSRTSIVYGAFASLPVLLMWLQWSCLLILIGAEMSYCIQNNEDFEYESDLSRMSRRYKDFIMLYLLSGIVRRFQDDEIPLTAREIAETQHLPVRMVTQLLSRLEETHIIREVYVEGKEDRTYVPAMDIRRITLGMVTDRIDSQGIEMFLKNVSPAMDAFWHKFLQVKAEQSTLQNILVADLNP